MVVQGDWGSRTPKKKTYSTTYKPPARSNPVSNLKHMQAQRASQITPSRPAPRSNPVQNLQNMQAQRTQGITGPAAVAPAPVPYQAPYQAPTYQAPYSGGGGFASQNFAAPGGDAGFAMPPAPPPIKQLNKEDWLAGDADYKDQLNEYSRAMNEFKSRIAKRKGEFDLDAKQSTDVTNQNQSMTLNNLGEDFGARGMSYSGLFDKSKEETGDQFKRQLANIVQMKNRNYGQADEQMADYSTENKLSRSNAMRQALQRMAQQQAILNAGG